MSDVRDARFRITGGHGAARTVSASNGTSQDYHQRQRRYNQRGKGNWKNRGGPGGRGGYGRGGVNPRSRLDAEGDEIMDETSPSQRL
jgi:hypothetical protein